MIHTALVFIVIATLGSAVGRTLVADTCSASESSQSLRETCQKIASSTSAASEVYGYLSSNYLQDIGHWAASSTQLAACSFQPGTPDDVGIALQILGKTRTPFAVKGGGHTTNPGFSSTIGVQIAMSRFSDVVYDATSQTATIGAGLIWDDVYAALEPYGVNVVGGRVSGVGVAGFTLGGGYSWLTNQYGLTIDTVQAFELVMPNGTVANVTETSSPDLFFALKGGLNNFGVVTRFTLRTFPQTQGGMILYAGDVANEVSQATANFAADNTDPKAQIITSYIQTPSQLLMAVIIFYDGPAQPAGIFDEFLAISSLSEGMATRPFAAFLQSLPTGSPPTRAIFNSVYVTNFTLSLLELTINEAAHWVKALSGSVSSVGYNVEPFLPTLFNHNTTPSAYPYDRTRGFFPLELYFTWDSQDSDQAVYDAVRKSAQTLEAGHGCANVTLYPNYAVFDTPLVELYGSNLPRLQAIKEAVDPENVMGLAGGFKL